MGPYATPSLTASSPAGSARRLGYYLSLLIAGITAITLGIGFFTPPISGPNCRENCIEYPYLDIASRFPRDYIWMFPAIVLTLLFVALMVCIHYHAPEGAKVFSHIGLALALMSAVLLVANYFVQVSVIQPSLDNGEVDGIALLSQYNPNGLFIALEEIGYLLMSAALFCVVPVFSSANRLERALRWIFIAGFVLALVALAAVSVQHGVHREYRFEVIVISINWIVLIVAGVLLSAVFKRATNAPIEESGNR